MKRNLLILSLLIISRYSVCAQQVADTSYRPLLANPEYQKGVGPVVYIDEGHNNFHTASGRYLPFANVLRAVDYRVKEFAGKFTGHNYRLLLNIIHWLDNR